MYPKIISLIFAATLPFLFSLNGDFVFDDSEAILNNKDVVSQSWTKLFNNDFWGTDMRNDLSHKSYRPFTIVTFRLNYLLNNKTFSATQFKITNLLCHALCCFLVYVTYKIIVKDIVRPNHKTWKGIDIAYYAALLFAVHPIHTEAVSGIVGRADILAGTLFFFSFKLYRLSKIDRPNILLTGTVILALYSMFFKENGVTVLGFCIAYELINDFKINKDQNARNSDIFYKVNISIDCVRRVVVLILSTIFLLYVRWYAMGFVKPEFKASDNPASHSESIFTRFATYNYIYFLNLLLLIWPQWLCYDWSMGCIQLVTKVLDVRLLLVLAMYVYGCLFINMIFKKTVKGRTKRLTLAAVSLAVLPFLPAANIFFPVGFVIAERVLYIPSAGYCLLVSIGFNKLYCLERNKKFKISKTLFILLLLLFGLRSWKRSFDWKTEHQLFVSGMSVCPQNAKIHYNMAKVADKRNQTEQALKEYGEAIRLYPKYYQAMNNLANMLKKQEKYDQAEIYLKTAVIIKKDFPAAWMNLGIVLAQQNRFDASLEAYKKALEYRRNYPDCYYNMGNLFLNREDFENAFQHWLHATKLNPKLEVAWINLLVLIDNKNKLQYALEMIPTAVRELPKSAPIAFSAANLYGKLERFEDAEKYFKIALQLYGDKAEARHYSNLGVLYHRWRKFTAAKEMYLKALAIDPKFISARGNLEDIDRKV